jgi:hypothetical protein
MKIKLITLAALAVCGSSAFAAAPNCDATAKSTALGLVNNCVPEVTIYMAGASAQGPALKTVLLTTTAVFKTDLPIAYVTNAATSALADIGAKNTVIYYGTGLTGKRTAVVYNTANGSFAGVKQMIEGAPTSSTFAGELNSQGLLTTADTAAMACTAGSAISITDVYVPTSVGAVSCAVKPFNYVTTAAPGGVAGVQLALADVAPNQATPGVLTTAWKPATFPATVTGVQGFGVLMNNVALTALIKREVAAGRMADSCLDKSGAIPAVAAKAAVAATETTPAVAAVTAVPEVAATVTAACQPNLSRADMAALVTGKATGAMLGDSSKNISYYRRVAFSGTQAASNLTFAGMAAIEGFKPADAAAGKATGFAILADVGDADATGNYSKTNAAGTFTTYAKVGSGDVITGVAGNKTDMAFGVVSLEKVYGTGTSADTKGATWAKLDGISPNFKADGTNDTKQRVGMQAGYPMQYEMVALKNTKLMAKTPAIKAVVDAIVTALADEKYNLAGIAYIGASDATRKATYHRGGKNNNFAPLNIAP